MIIEERKYEDILDSIMEIGYKYGSKVEIRKIG